MNRLLLLFFLGVPGIAGCDFKRVACKTNPLDVHIAPECRVKCSVNLGLITSDPNSLIEAAKDAAAKCEARRALCESALTRAQDAGVIK